VQLNAIARPGAAFVLALTTAACIAPVVERTDHQESAEGAYRKVAIVPFHPWPTAARAGQGVGGPPPEAPPIVANFVAAALAARGVEVVSPEEVASALGLEVEPMRDLDPADLARFVKERFGASAVLVGEVFRYRDRAAVGTRPSVSFEVTSYATPQGSKLTTIRFDETQAGITERPSNVVRMPGSGTRWLTPVELSQWGADAAAEALVTSPPEPPEPPEVEAP
jgi:hypothetical protein